MSRRYAIYFAPEEGTELARFGSSWLGGRVPRVDPTVHADMTEEPRLYGFHATLKPPFHLADGIHPAALRDAMAEFSGKRRPFVEAPLILAWLNGFLAFRPPRFSASIDQLAADCVQDFDRFRAPLTEAERRKRLAAPLSERQKELLDRWGYPYVLDQFRFHLTLTRSLRDDEASVAELMAELAAAALAEPLEIRSLCLFEQAGPGAAFALAARFPFGG